MSAEIRKPRKYRNLFLGVFAGLGLVIVASILARLVAGTFITQNICSTYLNSSFPSPEGDFEAVLHYKDCSETGTTSEVYLGRSDNPSTQAVLLTIERPEQHGSYPTAIELLWLSPQHLEISAPDEYLPRYRPDELLGATISYRGLN